MSLWPSAYEANRATSPYPPATGGTPSSGDETSLPPCLPFTTLPYWGEGQDSNLHAAFATADLIDVVSPASGDAIGREPSKGNERSLEDSNLLLRRFGLRICQRDVLPPASGLPFIRWWGRSSKDDETSLLVCCHYTTRPWWARRDSNPLPSISSRDVVPSAFELPHLKIGGTPSKG